MQYTPAEKAFPIRQPSTANLMIDSADRPPIIDLSGDDISSPWDFQISKKQSILNGFFTRIGTTEVVLEWCEPNINALYDTDTITFDLSGTGANTYVGTQTIVLTDGFYTIETLLDTLVTQLNDLSGTTGMTFSVVTTAGVVALVSTGGDFDVVPGTLANKLKLEKELNSNNEWYVSPCADLRLLRYLDFVSSELTYNQDLKDNSTLVFNRDVLCRWYMAWDSPPQLDGYGFPILMGYTSFTTRRLYNPPKQIRWEPNQPLGNISFQVYDDNGELVKDTDDSQWLMTLQVSEV